MTNKTISGIFIFALIFSACKTQNQDKDKAEHNTVNEKLTTMEETIYHFKVTDINGNEFDFSTLKGKKALIVNTASECGLTPQYEQLQELYDSLGGDKFEIIGFPANNFGSQEPGSDAEISTFCQKNYGVTFPMMSKISVKGKDIHPLYQWLISQEESKTGEKDFNVAWNFHKFLIDENGKYVKQIHPKTLPIDEEIINWITK